MRNVELAWIVVRTINAVLHLPMVKHITVAEGPLKGIRATKSTWNARLEYNLRGRAVPPLTEEEMEEACPDHDWPCWDD